MLNAAPMSGNSMSWKQVERTRVNFALFTN